MEKNYQSAFKPVQPLAEEHVPQKEEQSDDEVDIETTDEKSEITAGSRWSPKQEKVSFYTVYT